MQKETQILKLQSEIDIFLGLMLSKIISQNCEYSQHQYKLVKSRLTNKKFAQILGLNESVLIEFESALDQFENHRNGSVNSYTCCLRVCLWIETISKNLNIEFSPQAIEENSTEEIAIKQVRAFELILRSLLNEQLGSSDSVTTTLRTIFNKEVIDKWLKSSDQTGILSGTTFSELSNILLDKNIFVSVEEIFDQIQIKLSRSTRESLRYILEDIRIIRNAIAHNKLISKIQIEALNNYYLLLSEFIEKSEKTKIDVKSYFDLASSNILSYFNALKEDNLQVSGSLSSLNNKSDLIISSSKRLNKKTNIVVFLILLTLLISIFVF